MNNKPDKLKIEFLKCIRKGLSVQEAASNVGINYRTALRWSKKWHLIHVDLLDSCRILAFKIKDEVQKPKLSAYEIERLANALKAIEDNLFMYDPLMLAEIEKTQKNENKSK